MTDSKLTPLGQRPTRLARGLLTLLLSLGGLLCGPQLYAANVTAYATNATAATNTLDTTSESSPTASDSRGPRIVALAPHLVENLYAIGAGANIVGTTDFADYPEAALNIPRIGNYHRIQIEQVLALKPDLVLAWRSGNPSDDLQRLQQLGINVVYTDIVSLNALAGHFRELGELTKHRQTANRIASHIELRLAQLAAQYQHQAKVPVFYELWGNPLTTVANQAWPAQQLALCGGQNIFADAIDDYPQVGIEQVLVRQPQVIVQPLSKTERSNELDWQQWPTIPAVAQQRFSRPDSDLLHRTTLRMLEGLTQLCQDIDRFRQQLSTKEAAKPE